jgi:hypothetical protein
MKSLKKLTLKKDIHTEMAGERGFEPLLYGPEPHVLPLDDSPLKKSNYVVE